MELYKRLLLANKAWREENNEGNRTVLNSIASDQKAEFLWIGCSDSRVPAELITGTRAGELYVHRNVANLVKSTDANGLSALEYAVNVLSVKDIIVCGHYNCGGIAAALEGDNSSSVALTEWISSVKSLAQENSSKLEVCTSQEQRSNLLAELNVKSQAKNLAELAVVKKAWQERKAPTIHGWIFNLKTGLLEELLKIDPS